MFLELGGGGLRAVYAYEGMVEALDHQKKDWRGRLKGLAGVSAGAISCLAVALGITAEARRRCIKSFNFEMRADLSRLVGSYAATDGSMLRETIAQLLASGGLSVESTLADLERLLRIRFVCVAVDLCAQKVCFLEASEFPGMRVLDAVYASSAIPLVFPPLHYGGRILVDGGTLTAMPGCFEGEDVWRVGVARYEPPCAVENCTEYVHALLGLLMAQRDAPPQPLLLPLGEVGRDQLIVHAADAAELRNLGYAFTLDRLCGVELVPWVCKATALVAGLIRVHEAAHGEGV